MGDRVEEEEHKMGYEVFVCLETYCRGCRIESDRA